MYPETTDYETIDSFDNTDLKRLDKIIIELKNNAPYIQWGTSWHDYESITGEITSYVTLKVPLEQYDDAEEIYEKYTSGEDISSFVPKGKFPGIYELKEGKWELNQIIDEFICLLSYLDYEIYHASQTPVAKTLKSIAKVLSEIYTKAWELPKGEYMDVEIDDRVKKQNMFSKEQIIDCYINCKVDLLLITDILNDIINDITNWEDYYDVYNYWDIDPSIMAGIVYEWNYSFRDIEGWGGKILAVLALIHKSISQLKQND
jgi:hypothetical protein